jgi:Tfp pilus assembly protein PilE
MKNIAKFVAVVAVMVAIVSPAWPSPIGRSQIASPAWPSPIGR